VQWIAIDEHNSHKHIIEKSTNGQQYAGIGEVASQNLGSIPAYYYFVDETPERNMLLYYRIRQLDYDGKENVSTPLYIRVKDVANHRIFLSPMPISGIGCFSMEFYWPKADVLAHFRILDMNGRMVEEFHEPLMEGYNNLMHQFYGIEPGQYLMVLSDKDGDFVTEKFIIGM
jgi:hypothetical protein